MSRKTVKTERIKISNPRNPPTPTRNRDFVYLIPDRKWPSHNSSRTNFKNKPRRHRYSIPLKILQNLKVYRHQRSKFQTVMTTLKVTQNHPRTSHTSLQTPNTSQPSFLEPAPKPSNCLVKSSKLMLNPFQPIILRGKMIAFPIPKSYPR